MVAVGTPYPLSLVYPRSWQYKRYIATKTLEYTKSESLIVPQPSPTGEAPLELNQPNMILDAKYNYRLIQLSAIVKITNIINQNIDEYVTLCRRFGNKEEHPKN